MPSSHAGCRVRCSYYTPAVDLEDARFLWGEPDVSGLQSFCLTQLGWEPSKTRDILKPVLEHQQRLRSARQHRIDNLLAAAPASKSGATAVPSRLTSERVRRAVERLRPSA